MRRFYSILQPLIAEPAGQAAFAGAGEVQIGQRVLPVEHIGHRDEQVPATLVDPLNASRWCETRSPDREDYSETEADYLATIEEELPAGLDELIDLVLEFIEEEELG